MRDDERPLSEVMPALLRPGGLQELAEAALRRTLAADPHDTDARWKLAGIHRRQGNFAAARDLYRRLGARGPDRRKAAWLHAVLGGGGPPEAAPRGIWPAPFVWMTNFLAPGQCDRLLALALQGRERFRATSSCVRRLSCQPPQTSSNRIFPASCSSAVRLMGHLLKALHETGQLTRYYTGQTTCS